MTRTEPSFIEAGAREYLHKLAEAMEPDALARIRRASLEDDGPVITAEAGNVLHALTAAARANRVLEVGTLYGYSAARIAQALPEAGRVDTIEMDGETADRAEAFLREADLAERVTVHRGSALDVLPTLEGPFDVVFMDAMKSELPQYLEHAFRVTKPGALIIADNVLWHGRAWDPNARDEDTLGVRAFTEAITNDARLATTILPVGDGLSVSVRVS